MELKEATLIEALQHNLEAGKEFFGRMEKELETMDRADKKELLHVLTLIGGAALLFDLTRDTGDRQARQEAARQVHPFYVSSFIHVWENAAANLLTDDIYSILEEEKPDAGRPEKRP